jgi:flagellar protein FliT
MNATTTSNPHAMDTRLLGYYEALERASNDMLAAARAANWDQVVKL